jgi:hypothetical protein
MSAFFYALKTDVVPPSDCGGLHRSSASIPQHGACAADSDDCLFQDTSLVYVISATDFLGRATASVQNSTTLNDLLYGDLKRP